MKQLGNGISQYEYLESLGPKLGGLARRLLDNYVDKWDYRDMGNLFYEDAVTREASRSKWRNFYKAKAVFDLRQIQVAPRGVPPVQLDQLDDQFWSLQNWRSFSASSRRRSMRHRRSTSKTCTHFQPFPVSHSLS